MFGYLGGLKRRHVPAALAALICGNEGVRAQTDLDLGSSTAKLRALRAECEEAGASVKATSLPETHTLYLAARRDYGKARAAVEEVIGLLRQALLNGNEAEIAKSKNLTRAANDSLSACSAFLISADNALKRTQKRNLGAAVAALGSIVALALEIVKLASQSAELGDKVDDRRRKRADQLESELVWKSWSDLPGRKT